MLTACIIVASLAIVGSWIYRLRDVSDIPDVGDPYDVQEVEEADRDPGGRERLCNLRGGPSQAWDRDKGRLGPAQG